MKRWVGALAVVLAALAAVAVVACDGSVEHARASSGGGGAASTGSTPDRCADAEVQLASAGDGAPSDVKMSMCLERALALDAQGLAPCVVFESIDASPCACDEALGRLPIAPAHHVAYERANAELEAKGWPTACVRELRQASAAELATCDGPQGPKEPDCELHGFGYADDAHSPGDVCSTATCGTAATLCLGPSSAHAGAKQVAVCGATWVAGDG